MKTINYLSFLIFASILVTFNSGQTKSQSFVEQNETIPDAVFASSSAWGDYNNDGNLDILLTGNISGTTGISSIYRNNGNFTFTKQTGINLTGVYNSAVTWGDYDNDDDLDLILTGNISSTTRTTKIYRNNGDGTFTEQTGISLTAVSNGSASFGDYNNDGFLDILLSGYTGGNRVTKIYKNNGNNSFTEQTGISLIGIMNGSSAWIDYDRDGDLDISLTGNSSSGNVTRIYKNNGNNTFTHQTGIVLTGLNYSTIAWGDYDNDGDQDLFLSGQVNTTTRQSKIYLHNADHSFTEQTGISLTGVEKGSSAWGDFDNDGDLDLLINGFTGTDSISKIYENNGTNTFIDRTDIRLKGVSQGSVLWGDCDNDGDLDILMSGLNGSARFSRVYKNVSSIANTNPSVPLNLQYVINQYDLTFTWDKSTDAETTQDGLSYNFYVSDHSGTIFFPVMADVSTGFRKVVAVGNTSANCSQFMKNLLGGKTYYFGVQAIDHGYKGSSFSEQEFFKPAIRPSVQSSAIVKTTSTDTTITIGWTNGNGIRRAVFMKQDINGQAIPADSITYPASSRFGAGGQIGTTGWYCVYNGGGNQVTINGLQPAKKYRMMVCEYDGAEGKEVYNTSSSANNPLTVNTVWFQQQTGISLETANLGTAKWGDFDNDGDLDILLIGSNPPLYENNGNNTFTEVPISVGYLSWTSGDWGDYNNDGYLDIIVAGYRGTDDHFTRVYKNNGDQTFSVQTDIVLPNVAFGSVEWGDYDKDGDPDILVTGEESSNAFIAAVYKNNGDNTFTEQKGIQLMKLINNFATWGDYDNDGDLDILTTGWDNYDPFSIIYRNNGDNTFTDQSAINLTPVYYGDIAWGDCDNDGDLDILLCGQINTTNSRISKIYRNNGNNTFTEIASLTGVDDGSADWGDFDNDGDLDIVLTGNSSSGAIAKIYSNNGDATFSEETGIPLAAVSNSTVEWGDYDNDGDLDILYSGNTGSKIYKNLSVKANTLPAVPANLQATVNDCEITFSWEKSNDGETPQNAITYNLYVSDQSHKETVNSAMSDLSNGFRKIVKQGNASTNTSYTIKNLRGNKTYYWSVQAVDNVFAGSAFYPEQSFVKPITRPSVQASRIVQTASTDSSVTLRWLNGNGYKRVVFVNTSDRPLTFPEDHTTYYANNRYMAGSQIGSSGWYCVHNSSDCEFTVAGLQAAEAYKFVVYEYDGDEGNELYNLNTAEGNPQILESSYFEAQAGTVFPGAGAGSVAWGDYDNDHDLDILLTGRNSAGYLSRIYKNNGDETFTEQAGISLTGINNGTAAWGDFNNDNYLDILLTGYSGTTKVSKVYANNGNNTFTEQTGILLTPVEWSSAAWADYDNDGYQDILLTGTAASGRISRIYRNNGDSTFTEQSGIVLANVSSGAVAWCDYDKDGWQDILLTGNTGSALVAKIYKNNGDNTFTDQAGIQLTPVYSSSVAWGDYDNDGYPDILLTGLTSSKRISKVYKNNGNGTFSEQKDICLPGISNGTGVWGDYDSDGDLDILLTGYYYTDSKRCAKIYKNYGNNTFVEQTGLPFLKTSYSSVAFGDYNNDNRLDILWTGYSGASVSTALTKLYKNISAAANTFPASPGNLQVDKEGNSVTLSWDKSNDHETPQNGLSYNVYVSAQEDTGNVKNSMSCAVNGYRKIVQCGNTGQTTSYTIHNLSEEKVYKWSVQAIDGSFSGSPFAEEQSFVLAKTDQTITFNVLPVKNYGDSQFELTATASSGLPVSYMSSDTNVVVVSGNVVTITGSGYSTITASQEGNDDYHPALDVSQNLQVEKSNQAIIFPVLPEKTFGDGQFELTATASSGLPVWYVSSDTNVALITGNTVNITGPGYSMITASQEGNNNFNPAQDISQNLQVEKSHQAITFPVLPQKTFGDSQFELTATASSGLPVFFRSSDTSMAKINGNVLTVRGAGYVNITAGQEGNYYFRSAPEITQSLHILKADQTITFDPLPEISSADDPLELTAAASSGLPVSFSSSNPEIATISGNFLIISGSGISNITASQPGDENFNPAENVDQVLNVSTVNRTPEPISRSIKIYPNPVKNQLNVESDGIILKYDIINLTGETCLAGANAERTLQLNTEVLGPGIYMIKIVINDQVIISRFLKE